MGWGFQLIIALAGLCYTLLIAAVIATALAIHAFFVAKRLLRHRSAKPRRPALLISASTFLVVIVSAFQLEWAIAMWPVTHPPPPTQADILGTWVPTEWPITWMTERQFPIGNQRIEFLPDGTFHITEIPSSWLLGIIATEAPTFTGSGTWQMIQRGKSWELALTFESSGSGPSSTTYNAPWIPSMGLIYFGVPAESSQASYQKCGPPKMSLSDSAMDPYRAAIQAVDRDGFGFTPIPDDAWVELQPVGGPQVWIDVYGDTSHTITLKATENGYRWIYEQEIAYGPDQWSDADGSMWQEMISIDYQTEEINGVPLNRTAVTYCGRDPRITSLGPLWLDIGDVRPYLNEWKLWRSQQPPDPIDLCP